MSDAKLLPDEALFRSVMGHFATGVTVVAARRDDGRPCGLTANAVTSVSLHPLLVLVCLDRAAASHACVTSGGVFAISVLRADQAEVARLFSEGPREDRFERVRWVEAATGSPVLEGALAWIDCRVHAIHDAGDHSIVIGEVLECRADEGDPLIFYRGDYRRIAP